MKGMATCKVCGRDFALMFEEHYVVRDNEITGLAPVIRGEAESMLHDAFDCPHCGCQYIAQERKRPFNYLEKLKEEDTDEEPYIGECKTCKHADKKMMDEPCNTCNHNDGSLNNYEEV